MKLTRRITEYRNAILYTLIIGEDTVVKSLYIDRFQALETQTGSDIANRIRDLSSNSDLLIK